MFFRPEPWGKGRLLFPTPLPPSFPGSYPLAAPPSVTGSGNPAVDPPEEGGMKRRPVGARGEGMELSWHFIEKDFFQDLPREKEAFLSLAVHRSYGKNQYIFRAGSAGDSAFYLAEGKIRIFRDSAQGKEAIVFIRQAGEVFGLAEIMGRYERVNSAQAMTPCRLYEIRKKDFEMLLRRHFSLAQRVIEVLGKRVRYLGEQLESLIVCDVPTRLLRLLACLCCPGMPDPRMPDKPVSLPIKPTQEQIAAMIGSTQQTVSETLKKMKEEGLIEISGKGFGFLRYAKQEFADFEFRCEYRWAKEGGNSEVALRTPPKGDPVIRVTE